MEFQVTDFQAISRTVSLNFTSICGKEAENHKWKDKMRKIKF